MMKKPSFAGPINGNGTVSPSSSAPSSRARAKEDQKEKRKAPTAQELISHYETQGLETKEASIKVIDDLQKMLFKVVSSGRLKKDRLMSDSSRKLDNVQTRLAVIESKVDSKPGYGEALAMGVTAVGVLKGIGVAFPHVFTTLGRIWNVVRNTTATNSSSS